MALLRLVKDELEMFADPDAATRYRRIEDRARREFDQGYWWRPGHAVPEAVQ